MKNANGRSRMVKWNNIDIAEKISQAVQKSIYGGFFCQTLPLYLLFFFGLCF